FRHYWDGLLERAERGVPTLNADPGMAGPTRPRACGGWPNDLPSIDDIDRATRDPPTGRLRACRRPPCAPGTGMAGLYGAGDETESIATIHAALDAGDTLLDAGDCYSAGHNELLIGRAPARSSRQGAGLRQVRCAAFARRKLGRHGYEASRGENFVAYTLTRIELAIAWVLPKGTT